MESVSSCSIIVFIVHSEFRQRWELEQTCAIPTSGACSTQSRRCGPKLDRTGGDNNVLVVPAERDQYTIPSIAVVPTPTVCCVSLALKVLGGPPDPK